MTHRATWIYDLSFRDDLNHSSLKLTPFLLKSASCLISLALLWFTWVYLCVYNNEEEVAG